MRRLFAWCNANLEYVLMNLSYGLCTLIIFEEAVRRYAFRSQSPWGGQVAIYLFIWLSWIACAYAIKSRAHLRFDELRKRLPYTAQFALQLLDCVGWIALAAIIFHFSLRQIAVQQQIGSVVQGTDGFPLWVAFLGIPFGWSLVVWRTIQCAIEDYRRFRAKEPLIDTFSIDEVV